MVVFGNNDITKYMEKYKLDKIKSLIYNFVRNNEVEKYNYDRDGKKIYVLIKVPLTYNKDDNKETIKEKALATLENELNDSADWRDSYRILIKKGEYDEKEYVLDGTFTEIKVISVKEKNESKKTNRPSPSESATIFEVGIKKRGNDGNIWIITQDKNGTKRWKIQ